MLCVMSNLSCVLHILLALVSLLMLCWYETRLFSIRGWWLMIILELCCWLSINSWTITNCAVLSGKLFRAPLSMVDINWSLYESLAWEHIYWNTIGVSSITTRWTAFTRYHSIKGVPTYLMLVHCLELLTVFILLVQ